MNRKKLSILFLIFVGLCIVATIPWWRPYTALLARPLTKDVLRLGSFTAENVQRLTIEKEGEETRILAKKKAGWEVNGFDASKKEMSELFDILKHLEVDGVVSKNPDNHEHFGFRHKEVFILTFNTKKGTTTFLIGSTGTDPNSFYIKKRDANEVFSVSGGPFRARVSQNVSQWRDQEMVK